MLNPRSRPIRTVLIWQCVATALIAVISGLVAGQRGAISGVLGGAVGIAGGLAFSWYASRSKAVTADGVLFAALKAEGVKILVLIGLLALILATYDDVAVPGLIGAFLVSSLIFGFAFFVRDN